VRFSPPEILLTPETRWVLLRAFGPAGSQPPEAFAVDAAVETARRLELAARIAARAGRGALAVELGEGPAGALASRAREAAARELLLRGLAEEVGRAARERGLTVVLLKFAALAAAERLAAGSRAAGDLDVLAGAGEEGSLQEALLARGFGFTGQSGRDHHLPALAHPRLGMIEIHRHLPGVVAPGSARLATAEDLAREGALREAPGLPDLRVPALPVVLAHGLAHALFQHGLAPEAYPPFRGVSDWIDLGLGGPGGAELLAGARGWLAPDFPAGELDAARELAALLAEGRPEALEGGSAGARLGRHFLAGALDSRYRRSLAVRRIAPPRGVAEERGRVARALARAFFPARAELDAIYGATDSRLLRAARRALRPVDLAWRTARSLASRVDPRGRAPLRL